MKFAPTTAALLIAMTLLAACTPTGQVTREEPLRIGGLFALTGDGASWGIDEHNSVLLAIEEANAQGGIRGRQLALAAEDTQTSPTTTLTGMQRLAAARVPVIIGATWEESTAPIAPVADQSKIVLISPSVSEAIERGRDHPYLFTTWYSDLSQTRKLLEHMQQKEIRTVVLIHNQNVWAQFRRDIFVELAPEYGIEVVEEFPLDDNVRDFRTVLLQLPRADAIYMAFTTDETIQPFMKQAEERRLRIPIYSAAGGQSEALASWYGVYRGGAYHAYISQTPKIEEFNQRYEARFGKAPQSPSAPNAYDAANLAIAALRKGYETGPEIKVWLDTQQGHPGIAVANITFDEHGWLDAGTDAYIITTVRNGTFVEDQP